LRGGGGIDRFDGGPDGASCDAAGHSAGAVRCAAPPVPASPATANGGERSVGEGTSPTTAGPVPTVSPTPTTSPAPTASPTPTAAAMPASVGSASPTTPSAQGRPHGDGTASGAHRAGVRRPGTAPTEASVPPSSTTTA
jgi:hypothetical protein